MTTTEFKTWDVHKAENLQSQRDNALAENEAMVRELGQAKLTHAQDLKELEERNAAAFKQLRADAQSTLAFHVAEAAAAKEQVVDLQAELETAKQEIARLREAHANELSHRQKQIEALNGTELGRITSQRTANAKRRQELEAALAAMPKD